jgi:hypothetical protein
MLRQFTDELAAGWGVAAALKPAKLRVKSVWVSPRQAEASDSDDFLNSFIVADLDRVARSLSDAGAGVALSTFLTENADLDVASRQDLRERPDIALPVSTRSGHHSAGGLALPRRRWR